MSRLRSGNMKALFSIGVLLTVVVPGLYCSHGQSHEGSGGIARSRSWILKLVEKLFKGQSECK